MSKYIDRMKRGSELLKKMGKEGMLGDQKANSPQLYELTLGHLYGDIWTRPHLSLRDRELITLAANIALARTNGNHSHYHSALHIGVTKNQIMELIIHVGHYAGWPAMGLAARQFKRVLDIRAAGQRKNKPESAKELRAAWERNA